MAGTDWTREEVEAIVEDHLSMLASELAGAPYNKAAHRRTLWLRLKGRSEPSIEFKHCNISAAMLDAGFPPIVGYKPRWNYQRLLADVLSERLAGARQLHELAAASAEHPAVVPEVDDILSIAVAPPKPLIETTQVGEPSPPVLRITTNYIEREARNRSLGAAGELLVIEYERARLMHAGKEALASRIEHTSKVRGDHEGYDVLSFEVSGAERLIEVKTTKYGPETPFFVSRNEVAVSERRAPAYQLVRLYAFRTAPRLYALRGAVSRSCRLSASTFLAVPA